MQVKHNYPVFFFNYEKVKDKVKTIRQKSAKHNSDLVVYRFYKPMFNIRRKVEAAKTT